MRFMVVVVLTMILNGCLSTSKVSNQDGVVQTDTMGLGAGFLIDGTFFIGYIRKSVLEIKSKEDEQ